MGREVCWNGMTIKEMTYTLCAEGLANAERKGKARQNIYGESCLETLKSRSYLPVTGMAKRHDDF